jgi:hypothetical protein
MKRFLFTLCLLALPATAQATPVTLSGSGTSATSMSGATTTYNTGTVLAYTQLTSSSGPLGTFNATIREAVVRRADGGLDFLYQVTDNSGDALTRLSGGSYVNGAAVYTTTVEQATGVSGLSGVATSFTTGTIQSATADRSASGSTVGFNFDTSSSLTNLVAGTTSYVMIVHTNATAFTAGSASVHDSEVLGMLGFAPSPEPGTIVLLAGCLGGLGLNVGLRRRVRKTEPAVV